MPHEPISQRDNSATDSGSSNLNAGAAEVAGVSRRFPSLKPTGEYAHVAAIPLHRPITMLGARRTARIHLNSSTVSRAHALIIVTPGGAVISDLLSREGTLVNGRKVSETELHDGDELQVGRFTFRFQDPRTLSGAEPAHVEPAFLNVKTPAGTQRVALERRVTVIGRRSGSTVHLPFQDVSTANTAIVRVDGYSGESDALGFAGYAVFDLGGRGTVLNGQRVHKGRLTEEDSLRVGPAKISLSFAPKPAQPVAAPVPEPEPEPVAQEPEPPAEEVEPVEAVAIAAPPAEELDLDALALDEDLTAEGLDEDVLGGSFAMDRLAEPEAPQPAQEAAPEPDVPEATAEEVFGDEEADEAPAAPAPDAREPEVAGDAPAAPDEIETADAEPRAAGEAPAPEAGPEHELTAEERSGEEPSMIYVVERDARAPEVHVVDAEALLERQEPPASPEASEADGALQLDEPAPAQEAALPAAEQPAPAEQPQEPAPPKRRRRKGTRKRIQNLARAKQLLDPSDQARIVDEPEATPEPAAESAPPAAAQGDQVRRDAAGQVLSETAPTPESALDLSILDFDDGAASRSPQTVPPLTDSQALIELDALGESRAGADLVEVPAEAQQEPPAPAAEAEPPEVTPDDDWRGKWAEQQAAFLGNVAPIDLRKPQESPEPSAEESVEHAPEGLGEDYDAGIAPPEAPETSPPPEPAVASAAPPAPREPQRPEPRVEREDGQQEKPRPRKVGFGGPVAEVDSVVSPNAAGPFSSAPVGGASVLDPSAAMPDTSGLIGMADVFSLPSPGATEPLIPESTATATAEDEPGIDTSAGRPRSSSSRTTARKPAPAEPSGNGHAAPAADDDTIDSFLRTVRSGVRGLVDDQANGRPGVAEADLVTGLSDMEQDQQRVLVRPGGPRRAARPVAPRAVPPAVTAEMAAYGQRPGPRRRAWMVPLLLGLMVVTIISAVAGIYYGMEPTAPMSMKLRYDIPPAISQEKRLEYQQGQLNRLSSLEVRRAALDLFERSMPGFDPGFLANADAYHSFARRDAQWSTREPEVLVLSRPARESDRRMQAARLISVARALHDAASAERAAISRLSTDLRQDQSQLERLMRDTQDLARQIEELAATQPQAPLDPAELATRESELQGRIALLDEQWSAAERRVAQLRSQMEALAASDHLADDPTLQQLRNRLLDVQARIATLEMDRADAAAVPAGFVSRVSKVSQEPAGSAEAALDELRRAVEQAGASMDADGKAALEARMGSLSNAVTKLLEETLPLHLNVASRAEMRRQALSIARRQKLEALLETDETFIALRSEVALRERELGAAVSDGLEQRAAAARMALRVAQDRLSVHRNRLEHQVEEDVELLALQQASTLAQAEARQVLTRERDAARAEVERLSLELASQADDEDVRDILVRLKSALSEAISERAGRIPLAAEVWSSPAPKPSAPSQQPAGGRMQFMHIAAQVAQDEPDLVALQTQAAQLRRQIEQREAVLQGEKETEMTRLRQERAAAEAAAGRAQREAEQARTQLGDLRAGRLSAERQSQRLAELRALKSDREELLAQTRSQMDRARAALEVLATPRPPLESDLEWSMPQDNRINIILVSVAAIAVFFLIPIYLALRGGRI